MIRRNRKHANIEPNLTALIDVTFLLIVFFVLVSHIKDVEAVTMDLPKPTDPATVLPEAEHQVSVSVIPSPGGAALGYRVGDREFSSDRAGLDMLAAHLASMYRINAQMNINVRADRATHFSNIEPALQAVSRAARQASATAPVNPRVNLMVVTD